VLVNFTFNTLSDDELCLANVNHHFAKYVLDVSFEVFGVSILSYKYSAPVTLRLYVAHSTFVAATFALI
jgi:hypothetical protein